MNYNYELFYYFVLAFTLRGFVAFKIKMNWSNTIELL